MVSYYACASHCLSSPGIEAQEWGDFIYTEDFVFLCLDQVEATRAGHLDIVTVAFSKEYVSGVYCIFGFKL